MFLDLIMLFIFTFVIVSLLFTYYHHNKNWLDKENVNRNTICLLSLADCLWAATAKWLQYIDQLLINCVSFFLSDHLNGTTFIDGIKHSLNDTCSRDGSETNEALAKLEIIELSNTIYELYIDFWYQNVKLKDANIDNENFQYHCKKGIEEALTNFYQLCSEKINTKKLALELVKQIEAHLLDQHTANSRLQTKDEIVLLLNLIDGIFVQVLPPDVNSLVTNCSCCKNGAKKNCLQNSSNPVRLFIYNLIVYSLLMPLIDRITSPLYFFYNFIYIASKLDGLSLSEYISQFENNDRYEEEQTESQPVPITFESEYEEGEKALFYEAIEESRKELMVFSNLRIPNVKISSNEIMSSISKINPYIDYIILFNVLECDREMEKQKQNQQRLTGQTFLQRTYQVKRRFREFLSFQQKLEKNPDYRLIMAKINNKPSNIQFHSSSFLNYIKSTKINENSPLVKLRRDCLENFLNQLSKNKDINESREFCEFLGYKYKSLHEVKQLLKITFLNEDMKQKNKSSEKSNSKNFELNFTNLKDIFRIFLPVQAKLGQVATQIEDVVVNDQICSKYSITKIQTESNDQNHMVLKLKLDKWAALSANRDDESSSTSSQSATVCDTEASEFDHQLLSCLFVLFSRKYFVFQSYFVSRCAHFLQSIFSKLRNTFTFSSMFRFYLHYLHTYLVGLENDSMDDFLTSYERFYGLLREKDLKELFQLYVRLSEEKISKQYDNPTSSFNLRLHLHKAAFFLCNHLKLFDNLITSFDTQHSNKLLIYRLLQVFLNEINR